MEKAKKLSGAQCRKRKKEKEKASEGMRQKMLKWMKDSNRYELTYNETNDFTENKANVSLHVVLLLANIT